MNDPQELPKQRELLEPILKVLKDGNEKSVDEIVNSVVESLGLDPSVLSIESRYKGKSQLKYDAEWALNALKNKGLVKSPREKMRIITPEGRRVLDLNVDPATVPDANAKSESDRIPMSFFEYLSEKKLSFDTKTVENFLLSLKSKQFIILSGGTGTGKTKLAQAYGEFVSRQNRKMGTDIEVTIGKSIENGGFFLSRDSFFSSLPKSARRLDGTYSFSIGGVEGKCEIRMSPRLLFTKDKTNDAVFEKMRELKQKDDKTTLTLWMPMSPDNKNYEIVSVGSNWTDNRHILGYMNAISGEYSSTPALDLMIKSNKDFVHPYFLILDEMNLSYVERYFSDFISCMESGEPIQLSPGDRDDVPEIDPGDNLFVIGTVNMDETTYAFSPKVLDRANVLEFEAASVRDYMENDQREYSPTGDVEFLDDCMRGVECRTKSSSEILAEMIEDSPENDSVLESIVDVLERIQKQMFAMNLAFGYRTIDEISRFMYVSWIYEGRGHFKNWRRYMDAQVKQKVLPKIHGNSAISVQLGELKSICSGVGFKESETKLDRMIKVLETQRYVSFNC